MGGSGGGGDGGGGALEAVKFGWSGTDGARAPARRAFLRWRLPAPPYFFFFLLPDLLGRYSLEHP